MKYNIEAIEKRKDISKKFKFVVDIILVIIIYNIILVSISCINKIEEINIFGYTGYRIITESMKPNINSGDVVLVKTINGDKEEIKKGDVITFRKNLEVITHRVIDIEENNGENVYVTKGDNNNLEDQERVEKSELLGKVVVVIPYLGNIIGILENKIIFLILVLIFLILLLCKINIQEKKENRRLKKKIDDEKNRDK